MIGNHRRAVSVAVAYSICLALLGCDTGPQRVVVTGQVKFQEQPINQGTISFFPTERTQGTSVVIVPIVEGRYEVESHGGLPLGTYTVAILGVRVPAGASNTANERTATGERPPPRIETQYIPPKYNDKTELKATIDAGASPLTLDFALGN
jgi:hypothetical protein